MARFSLELSLAVGILLFILDLSFFPGIQALERSEKDGAGDFHTLSQQVERDNAEQQFMEWAQTCRSRYKAYQLVMKSQGLDNQTAPPPGVDGTEEGARGIRVIVVDQNGYGNYMTVQAAIDSISSGNQDRVVIHVHPGVYREKVTIDKHKPYITIVGGGRNNTVMVWNDTARDVSYNGSTLKTFRSASFAVDSYSFTAQDLSFVNDAPVAAAGEVGGQAVAFRASGDRAAFLNCGFYGGQDTLYDHKGRHYFENCYIEGTVDFIFGDGLSMYKNCTLKSIGPGAVTAQRRANSTDYSGFAIVDSIITGMGPSYLGRAWGNYSRVVFANSYIDVQVADGGWNNWNDPTRDWRVFYGQFNCSGPGANLTNRVAWSRELTAEEAQPFLSPSFVDAHQWLPDNLKWAD